MKIIDNGIGVVLVLMLFGIVDVSFWMIIGLWVLNQIIGGILRFIGNAILAGVEKYEDEKNSGNKLW